MSKLVLKKYQEETVQYAIENNYSIIAVQQGLGKTVIAIKAAIETNSKALIICPAYLKLRWKAEFDKFFPDKIISVLDKKEDFYFPWESDFVIISYSFIEHADVLFSWADMVILDECTAIKETSSKRSTHFHRLIYENSVKRCLLLTGTPILNRVYEFYSLIAVCNYDPRVIESPFLTRFSTYVDFANHFSYLEEREIYRGKRRVVVKQWSGARNVGELKRYLKNCYIRFRSQDVLDIPESNDLFIPIDSQDRPELLDAFYSFSEDNTSVQSKYKAEAALAKAPLTSEYVKGLLDQDLQVVVYSDHVESAEFIAKKLGVTAITGKTNIVWRQRFADEFQAGKLRVIVATIGSFSTGVDLFSAHNMVFSDFNWVPGNMEQAKFRIKRIGQSHKCFFHYMLGSKQDEIILGKLGSKQVTIDEVI